MSLFTGRDSQQENVQGASWQQEKVGFVGKITRDRWVFVRDKKLQWHDGDGDLETGGQMFWDRHRWLINSP